ncbi:hypothetical protein Vi05172_g4399 [Venturia inaequalis]|nr:hypothetical protein Vi05172_g4399 [Venturia inaequalis]
MIYFNPRLSKHATTDTKAVANAMLIDQSKPAFSASPTSHDPSNRPSSVITHLNVNKAKPGTTIPLTLRHEIRRQAGE